MAEGNNDKISPDESMKSQNSGSIEDSDDDDATIPDLGVENMRGVDKKTQQQNLENTPKREENPFSFKHFLKQDSSNSYQNQGARPKVYSHSSSVLDNHQPRLPPEFSSALPDFVQDHLVIEQCYLGSETSPQDLAVDLDNLPDFTPNRNGSNRSNLPLDLPARHRVGFPLDLPLTESNNSTSRSCSQSSEVGVSKSLPDFLSDGAVYTSQTEDNNISGQSPERETDRLRRELEVCRRQLSEQTRRADQLQRQLEASRNKEHEYTHNLTKAMEQIEENLNITSRRAVTAENTIVKLKQEIKQLNAEISHLQKENRNLRCEDGAIGGPSYVSSVDATQTHRFADELRTAASTAEHSLRQLLNGVDNLRMMASTIENMHRIEERTGTDSFLSDLDEDSGPAL